jgi:hypothetical protein
MADLDLPGKSRSRRIQPQRPGNVMECEFNSSSVFRIPEFRFIDSVSKQSCHYTQLQLNSNQMHHTQNLDQPVVHLTCKALKVADLV